MDLKLKVFEEEEEAAAAADRETKLKCSSFLNLTSIDIFLQKSEKM